LKIPFNHLSKKDSDNKKVGPLLTLIVNQSINQLERAKMTVTLFTKPVARLYEQKLGENENSPPAWYVC